MTRHFTMTTLFACNSLLLIAFSAIAWFLFPTWTLPTRSFTVSVLTVLCGITIYSIVRTYHLLLSFYDIPLQRTHSLLAHCRNRCVSSGTFLALIVVASRFAMT